MVDYREQANRHFKAGGKCFTGFVSDKDFNRACSIASKALTKILEKELLIFKIMKCKKYE